MLFLFIERSPKQMFQTSPLLDVFLYFHSAFQNDDNRIVFHNSDILNKATNSHIVIFRKSRLSADRHCFIFSISSFTFLFESIRPFIISSCSLKTTIENSTTSFLPETAFRHPSNLRQVPSFRPLFRLTFLTAFRWHTFQECHLLPLPHKQG